MLHDHIARGRTAVVAHLAQAVGPGLGPGRESPDPELFARTLSAVSDEGARLLLTDPEALSRRAHRRLRPLADGAGGRMSGIDPARLARLRTHFDRYVEDGRLPGWLAVVTATARPTSSAPAGATSRPTCRSRRTRSGASTR